MKKLIPLFAFLFMASSQALACDLTFEVSNGWAKPTVEGKNLTAAFFDIKNTGDKPIKLTEVSIPNGIAELHNTVEENGTFKMRQIESVEIPAGQTVNFKPRALHIMLTNLKKPLKESSKVKLSLHFDNDETLTITVPVSAKVVEGKIEPGHSHSHQH
jgi:copper(I)-binding protein